MLKEENKQQQQANMYYTMRTENTTIENKKRSQGTKDFSGEQNRNKYIKSVRFYLFSYICINTYNRMYPLSQNLIQSGSDFFYFYTIRNYKTFSVTLLNTGSLK